MDSNENEVVEDAREVNQDNSNASNDEINQEDTLQEDPTSPNTNDESSEDASNMEIENTSSSESKEPNNADIPGAQSERENIVSESTAEPSTSADNDSSKEIPTENVADQVVVEDNEESNPKPSDESNDNDTIEQAEADSDSISPKEHAADEDDHEGVQKIENDNHTAASNEEVQESQLPDGSTEREVTNSPENIKDDIPSQAEQKPSHDNQEEAKAEVADELEQHEDDTVTVDDNVNGSEDGNAVLENEDADQDPLVQEEEKTDEDSTLKANAEEKTDEDSTLKANAEEKTDEDRTLKANAEELAELKRQEEERHRKDMLVYKKDLIEKFQESSSKCRILNSELMSLQSQAAALLQQRRGLLPGTVATGDQNQRYKDMLNDLHDIEVQRHQHSDQVNSQNVSLQAMLSDLEGHVREAEKKFKSFRKKSALRTRSRQTGVRFKAEEFDELEAQLMERQRLVKAARIKWLRVEAGLKNRKQVLTQIEEASQGLHQIDLDQLKVERQGRQDKLEEKTQDLAKVKQRATRSVLILAHMKEKRQHLEMKKKRLREELTELESTLTRQREALTQAKKNRELGFRRNQKLKQKTAMLRSDALLRNYETTDSKLQSLREDAMKLESKRDKIVTSTLRATQKIHRNSPKL